MHRSIERISQKFFNHSNLQQTELDSWHFCDNEIDANECVKLVLEGLKKATSPSLWWFQANNAALPKVGDFNIVTNWAGEAQCIIETTNVVIVPFNEITEEYAELEGEGDKSLEYWKRVHWDYYHRELAGTQFTPSEDMPIVCETFKVVFKNT
ncbi:ASCH domain-containing protein [Alteromonas sp. ASW11-130]|uniref:ASCH domain-containing protein n=1 Tax=Alteromonas sp. ASW11-130 TaxID=3015775 RepID=UPI002241A0F7|nr:ASCH domain-containing protein [Alteromonas sp. ASW11-130]MCW8092001.1 ASCH domain-containing protein [Alteromonas sp. ASW11-130]